MGRSLSVFSCPDGLKGSDDPEERCLMLSIFFDSPEAKPVAHLTSYFRDMPWLWAVQSKWSRDHQICVRRTDRPEFFNTMIEPQDEVGICYIHTTTENSDQLHTMSIERPSPEILPTVFDATILLCKRGLDLSHIKHIVIPSTKVTDVYCPAKGLMSIAQQRD